MTGRWIIWDRFADGSRSLLGQFRTWLAAGDLTGKDRARTIAGRAGGAIICLWFAGGILYALGLLWWGITLIWTVSAIVAGRAPEIEPAPVPVEDEPEEPASDPRADFARWLLHVIRERPGVHLYELYNQMRALPGFESAADPQLRDALRVLGVPITRSLRVPPIEGRSGVRRGDALALLSPTGERPGENHGDAGQSHDSPALSVYGERVESA